MMVTASQCIGQELHNFNVAALNHTQAYHSFITLAQLGNWEAASRAQIQSASMLEAAMDAYMRACRIKSMAEGQEDEYLPD